MSVYSAFLRNTALPLVLKRYHRLSALKHRRFYERSQRWTRQELLDYQWRRLSELLNHAYASCPYYRRVFDERGLVPGSFKSIDDLGRLPVLSRRDTFDHFDGLVSDRYRRADLLESYTGGTTGQQARLYVDQESFNIKQAIAWRHESWMGCQPGDRLALFWPAHIDIPEHESWKARFVRKYLLRVEMVQGGSLNESLARRLAEQLRRFDPRYMKVFPASFTNFIEYAVSDGLPLPRLRGIMSTGEVLYPSQRRLMEETFGCPVYDMYGSREVGNTASECSAHRGMHVAMETSVVEFVRDGRPVAPGEEGEILVTDLTNYGMPLIRYQINDFGTPLAGSCSCGRELDRMDAAVGRLQDCFYGPDGTRHSGNVLGIHLTVGEDDVVVGQTQFIQKSLTHFLVRVTDKPEPTRETFNYLERRMKQIIGSGITVDFEVVARIPEERSGKTRFVICEIPPPGRG